MSVRAAFLAFLLVTVLLSVAAGVAAVSNGLAYNEFGRELCDYVRGNSGMLPINPDEGGTILYSCNLRPGITALYVFYYSVFWLPVMIAAAVPVLIAGKYIVRRLREGADFKQPESN